MDKKSVLELALMEQGKDVKWLAVELGIQLQSLRNKLSRGDYSVRDYEEMLSKVGAQLAVVTERGSILR